MELERRGTLSKLLLRFSLAEPHTLVGGLTRDHDANLPKLDNDITTIGNSQENGVNSISIEIDPSRIPGGKYHDTREAYPGEDSIRKKTVETELEKAQAHIDAMMASLDDIRLAYTVKKENTASAVKITLQIKSEDYERVIKPFTELPKAASNDEKNAVAGEFWQERDARAEQEYGAVAGGHVSLENQKNSHFPRTMKAVGF